MTVEGSETAMGRSPTRAPGSRWHLVYFALAGFDILTVCVSLFLNHQLMGLYTTSIEADRVWAERVANYSFLATLAAEANAPGNDVFESGDVKETTARLTEKVDDFLGALRLARADLVRNLPETTSAPMLVSLTEAERAMHAQSAEARRIFEHFGSGERDRAGARMAAMDHEYYAVTEALSVLMREATVVQGAEFEAQAAAAASMQRLEYLIASLIVMMVMSIAWYGHRLSGRMKQTSQQLEALAEEAQRSTRLAERRFDELTVAARRAEELKKSLDEHGIVSIADVKGNIIFANDKFCEISGYNREELLGKNHRIIKSDEHSPQFFRDLWRTVAQGGVWRGEIRNRRKDGSPYWVDATIVPFTDGTGRIEQYIAIRTDISPLKFSEQRTARLNVALEQQKQELVELNAHLEAAQDAAVLATKAKSEFLANMSHEIRTPMTSILGFSERLRAGGLSDADTRDAVDTIHRNGEFLLGLINDILDVSKIEAGKMTVEQTACSLQKIIPEVVELMRVRADAKNLSLDVNVTGPIPETISSDPTRLKQILINIIGNAVKFTERGGVSMTVQFVRDDVRPLLQFDVVDTGIGLTPEQCKTLFLPFSQADGTVTRKFGGTGLGLTISKRLCELLGGDLTIEETEPGRGSRFRFTIETGPINGQIMIEDIASRVQEAERLSEAPENTAPLNCRLLLAEDGPDNQRLISFMLRRAGAHVTVVANGREAIDAVHLAQREGRPFDVIVMDMQMPVLDGYTATAELRQEKYAGPIIALTAHAMHSDREKCIKAGCDDYVTKPIQRIKFIEVIRAKLLTGSA